MTQLRPQRWQSGSLWDELCLHAVFHWWNPLSFFLIDRWAAQVEIDCEGVYPGWGKARFAADE